MSVLTGECLEEPQTLTQWASSTLRKKGETLRELGVLKGLKQLHAEGMSAHTRKLVLDFYMAEQRNTDVVIREQKMFGLLSTGEMADFSEEDFAEAAAAGNFEYDMHCSLYTEEKMAGSDTYTFFHGLVQVPECDADLLPSPPRRGVQRAHRLQDGNRLHGLPCRFPHGKLASLARMGFVRLIEVETLCP